MHPTADTQDVIISKGAGRRVMPGVSCFYLEGDVLKLLFAAGIWLFAFLTSYMMVCAAPPVDESALQLTSEIVRQRYCEGDSKLDVIVLELRLRYRNLRSQPLILYKDGGDVYQIKISSSLADAGNGKYEATSSRT